MTTFQDLAQLLERTSNAILRFGVEREWEPTADSIAKAEIGSDAHPAYSNALLLILAACEHVNSASTLFDQNPPPVWSSLPVLRAAMDSALRAWWVLSPTDDATGRRARGYELLRLAIAETRRIPGRQDEAAPWRQLRARINDDGIPLQPPGSEGAINKIADVASPKFRDLYTELFADENFAVRLYGWLAGVGHGDVWFLSDSLRSRAENTKRRLLVAPDLELPFAALGVRAAVEITTSGFDRWSILYSWSEAWKPRSQALRAKGQEFEVGTRG